MKKLNTKSMLAGFVATIASVASAATTITVDSAIQRWPWNNKVDITYTVVDGQDVSSSRFRRLVFTATIDGTTYTIDGMKDVGASANSGTHTITWTAPSGVKCMDCTMSASVYTSDAPSGDDYIVIDLSKTSDSLTFEGLLSTQSASNDRYNTDTYKKDKLVLRKVPAGRYETGGPGVGANANSTATWTTDRAYYIGVFPVTQYQYNKLYGSNPSPADQKSDVEGNPAALRPVNGVSWNALRKSGTSSLSPIPEVDSNTGTFLQRLNYITGNKFGFDLPTELMQEIAQRAGTTTKYYWGDTPDTAYFVASGEEGGTVAAGSRLPNAWGLYDTSGNVAEWSLDDVIAGDLKARTDVFTPAWASGTQRRYRGGSFWSPSTSSYFQSGVRGEGVVATATSGFLGFRVSMIVK